MKIIDNCFNISTFEKLKAAVFDSSTPWHFTNTTYNGSTPENLDYKYSWVHTVSINEIPTSHLFNVIYPELVNLLVKNKVKFTKITRIRLGLITTTQSKIINDAHIDSNQNHNVGLIYLNTSDAPTYIYKEKYDPVSELEVLQYIKNHYNNNLNIQYVSQCEENKAIFFNGMHYHSSSTPTDVPRRVVINFNYS
jgi:hypothetical protein